jgi:hypothetical protein
MKQRPEPAPARAGVERMNRTIQEATVQRYRYDSHTQLTAHRQMNRAGFAGGSNS